MSFYVKGKGWFEDSGRPIGSKRKVDLARAKVCGFENDSATFTRLLVESRIARPLLNEQWRKGSEMRAKQAT